ncbi:hypothetical protein EKO27_g4893 [Xylaria grammica]|uniref:Nudix hydrolase domain-containing protein n=1 Tax=Xylaria grammica TaxID=363999 RepID=A0A439D726_9PEZI|nr:hypothetical protein EKO27_g4893 [Xylaria grammica]
MSRAQFFARLRFSSTHGARTTPILNCTGDEGGDGDETVIRSADDSKTPLGAADKLSVGVCIFRPDKKTLRPTVLLLRRSPRWWRRRVFMSTAGRQGAGEWELPGGRVSDDDFCISAAIERLVREKTGLRVTKIMVMLSDIRWGADLKVLLWNEDEGGAACEDSTEDDDDEDGDEDHSQNFGTGLSIDWNNSTSTAATTIITTTATYTATSIGKQRITGTVSTRDRQSSGKEDILALSDADVLGIRTPTGSSSPGSSPVPATPDFTSVPPPPPLPKDDGHDDKADKYGDGYYAYRADHDDDYKYVYYHDANHDPSLEPAPLALPSRAAEAAVPKMGAGEGKALRRRDTASSTALPAYLFPPDGGVGRPEARDKIKSKRRNAQVIPYKIVRKEYLQLNFAVLVDENGEDGLPGFLDEDSVGGGRRRWRRRRRRRRRRGRDEVDEHDALEWATGARVEEMPMNEDLRRVVLEGLALAGAFF